MGWNPGTWGTKAWAAVGAVVGGLAGAALAGGLAGAFTPTGPGVSGGSYPRIVVKAVCEAGPGKKVEMHVVPAGAVLVPDLAKATYGILALQRTPVDILEITDEQLNSTLGEVSGPHYGLLANDSLWLGGPLGPGTKVTYQCGSQTTAVAYWFVATLERK